jgi:sigma-B regulation protein RsbU (phosphoserine phosphatase)
MIIGPTPSATYEIGVTQMEPGDLLVLYTDGVIEAKAAGSNEEYGEDRLLHVVNTARRRDPVAIIERLFADLGEFSRTPHPADDQTVVVVKRRSEEPEEAPA